MLQVPPEGLEEQPLQGLLVQGLVGQVPLQQVGCPADHAAQQAPEPALVVRPEQVDVLHDGRHHLRQGCGRLEDGSPQTMRGFIRPGIARPQVLLPLLDSFCAHAREVVALLSVCVGHTCLSAVLGEL